MEFIEDFENLINNANKVLITSHEYADVDAVCSCQMMKLILKRAFNKDSEIVIDTAISKQLSPFSYKVNREGVSLDFDLAICLDIPTLDRLGKMKEVAMNAKNIINIDHHDLNSKFGKVNLVEEFSSSTCETLYQLCLANYPNVVDFDLAKYAFAGIITDTSNLKSIKVTARTYHTIGYIMETGLKIDLIKRYFFEVMTESKIKLMGNALSNVELFNNEKCALLELDYADFLKTDAKYEDALGLVDVALGVWNVMISASVIELMPNCFNVSLRGKDIDVAVLAQKFGGGGHKNMAAFQVKGDKEKLLSDLKVAMVEYLNKQQ